MATFVPVSNGNASSNGAGPRRTRPPWTLEDTLRVIAELGRALQDQCARAQRAYDHEPLNAAARAQIDVVAGQAREIHGRSQAIARGLAAHPGSSRTAAPQRPAAMQHSNGSAETRACAVSFAVALKLDGVSRERTQALLVDEFGRDDAAEIADQAFGPVRRAV